MYLSGGVLLLFSSLLNYQILIILSFVGLALESE